MTALISSSDNTRSNAGMSAVPATVTSCFARAKPSISVSKVHIPSGRSGKVVSVFVHDNRERTIPLRRRHGGGGNRRLLNFTSPLRPAVRAQRHRRAIAASRKAQAKGPPTNRQDVVDQCKSAFSPALLGIISSPSEPCLCDPQRRF